jgi:KaiC/GvpD/RAD55 family RecA-like ATPase
MHYAGEGVLRAAVETLAAEIQQATEKTSNVTMDAAVKARQTEQATKSVVAALDNVVAETKAAKDENQTRSQKRYLLVAIDRTSKFAFSQLHEKRPMCRRRLPPGSGCSRSLPAPHGAH